MAYDPTKEIMDLSTSPTMVQVAVRHQFRGKSPSVAAKEVAKKFGGSANMLLGQGVVFIDPKRLEEAMWDNMVDFTLPSIKKGPGMDSLRVKNTAQYFKLNSRDAKNLFDRIRKALGRPLDDSRNPFADNKSASRVASRWLQANSVPNILDGFDRRQALAVANKAIGTANLKGIFRDQYWAPVQRIWAALTKAGIDWEMERSWYDKDAQGNPASKIWTFTIQWKDKNGRPQVAHGRVVASGAGSVSDPLDAYDVVAYVS